MISNIAQVVFLIVLASLGCFLVPLLLQLRKTAKAIEELAKSANRDINRVADDVHQIKIQMDEIAELTKESLTLPANISQMVQTITHLILSFIDIQNEKSIFNNLLSGIQTIIAIFRKRGDTGEKEA